MGGRDIWLFGGVLFRSLLDAGLVDEVGMAVMSVLLGGGAPLLSKWQDGPLSLPSGVKIAVLEGDPTKPGPFVVRVKVPDGYKLPPHPKPEP